MNHAAHTHNKDACPTAGWCLPTAFAQPSERKPKRLSVQVNDGGASVCAVDWPANGG